MLRTQDNLHTLIDSFANPTKPVTLCSLSPEAGSPKFISATEIGYATANATSDPNVNITTIQRLSLSSGSKPVTVATVQGNVMDVAWSPDASSFAYLTYVTAANVGSGAGNQLWLKSGSAAPKPVSPLIPLFGRDGSVSDETIVRFSRDGKYLLMVDSFVTGAAPALEKLAAFQVISVQDGGLVWVPPSALGASGNKGGPFITMAVWSQTSDRLYYRDLTGVHTWDPPTTLGIMAAGLVWYSPSMSPDGSLLAYANNLTTQPRIEIRNVANGSIRVLAGLKGEPLLLSDQQMIEAHYIRNTQFGPPYTATGYYILDLLTNKETAIPGIYLPMDSWPH
jgi:hypothetical protein